MRSVTIFFFVVVAACGQDIGVGQDVHEGALSFSNEGNLTELGDPPAYEKNTTNDCAVVADVNAKLDAGMTFANQKTPAQARADIIQCLTNAQCYDKNGFGPPGKKPTQAQYDACVKALCECNDAAVEETLDCSSPSINVGPVAGGGNTADKCDDGDINVGFFGRPGGGGHAVTIVSVEGPDADGMYIIEIRDPNAPEDTSFVEVDSNGVVDESLIDPLVKEGDKLLGCYSTKKK